MIVNASGGVDSYNDFYPYGLQMAGRNQAGSADTRYKFTGKERDDAEEGYDYFGARYYDSWSARWLQVDPMAEKYPEFTPYNYAANNPVEYKDENGRMPTRPEAQEALRSIRNPFRGFLSLVHTATLAYLHGDIVGGLKADVAAGIAGTLGLLPVDPSGYSPAIITTGAEAAATQLAKNAAAGAEYESAALKAEGLEKNTTTFSAIDPKTGNVVKTIPDAVPNGQTVDAKNVSKLSDSPQLRAQRAISAANGKTAKVIVPSRTKLTKTIERTMEVKRFDNQ